MQKACRSDMSGKSPPSSPVNTIGVLHEDQPTHQSEGNKTCPDGAGGGGTGQYEDDPGLLHGQVLTTGRQDDDKVTEEKNEEEKTQDEEEDDIMFEYQSPPTNAQVSRMNEQLFRAYNTFDQKQLGGIFNVKQFSKNENWSIFSTEHICPLIPNVLMSQYLKDQPQPTDVPASHMVPAGTSHKYFSPQLVKSILSMSNFCPHSELRLDQDLLINGHLIYSPKTGMMGGPVLPPRLIVTVLAYDAICLVQAFEKNFISKKMFQYGMFLIGKIEAHPALAHFVSKSVYSAIAHRSLKSLPDKDFMGFRGLITAKHDWRMILQGNLIFFSPTVCTIPGCMGDLSKDLRSLVRPGRQTMVWTLDPLCCRYQQEPHLCHKIGGSIGCTEL